MTYLDQCREVVSTIDVEELGSNRLGEEVGSGSRFVFKQLGRLIVAQGKVQYVGLKLSFEKRYKDTEERVVIDIATIGLYTSGSPELLPKVPSFICLLKVQESEIAGILTEDVSEGGQKEVKQKRTSMATRELLYKPFEQYGTMDEVLDNETLDRATAFNVGGTEKLLDFTPPPVSGNIHFSSGAGLLEPYLYDAQNALPDLTVTISRDSQLTQSLLR